MGRWERAWRLLLTPESVITLIVLVACTGVTFKELQPSKLFLNTTPAGGDMGAHVWLPAYVKDHLIPNLRITGWAPDWYEGFPALTYYFPLPMFAIAFASYIIPYNISFKLISVAGLVTLPVCCWAFGRLARMPFPGPPCLAVGALAYLFGREFTIYGGNIASTMAGEFSFSISLSFAMLFLGVVARGLNTGRMRALAAVLLACTAFSHILPTFFAVGGAVVIFAMRLEWGRWRNNLRRLGWIAPVLIIGGLVTAVWSLPFEYRLPYATNMGYAKITTYLTSLFLPKELWLYVLAGIGFALSLARRRQLGIALGILAILAALVFRVAPQARLWNARVLPFWFLLLYLLAAVAFAELGMIALEAMRGWRSEYKYLTVPIGVLLIGLVWVGYPLWDLPFGHTVTKTTTVAGSTTQTTTTQYYDFFGVKSTDHSFISGWVNWNYSGYQSPGKSRGPEYFDLVDAMKSIGDDSSLGCGTALWEYEPELNDMGTPDALMLLPYWTNGCIGSEEGLYYESSASTPYHFLNVAELSDQPANPMAGLDYPSAPDVAEGIDHLQIQGVKYFMAETPDIEAAANADPDLKLIKSVGPFTVDYTTGTQLGDQQRTWDIYEVKDTALVTPLKNQPVVLDNLPSHDKVEQDWLNDTQDWYLAPNEWNTFETASGPASWTRVDPQPTTDTDGKLVYPNLPQKKLPPVKVTDIKQTTESISFNVSRVGVPVLIKQSYFPNWQASGAGEVYRASPNLMIVIPTSTHVKLNYGYTPVDWIGFILTLIGLAGVAEMLRRKPVQFEAPLPVAAGSPGYAYNGWHQGGSDYDTDDDADYDAAYNGPAHWASQPYTPPSYGEPIPFDDDAGVDGWSDDRTRADLQPFEERNSGADAWGDDPPPAWDRDSSSSGVGPGPDPLTFGLPPEDDEGPVDERPAGETPDTEAENENGESGSA
jgi:hypothetical protein